MNGPITIDALRASVAAHARNEKAQRAKEAEETERIVCELVEKNLARYRQSISDHIAVGITELRGRMHDTINFTHTTRWKKGSKRYGGAAEARMKNIVVEELKACGLRVISVIPDDYGSWWSWSISRIPADLIPPAEVASVPPNENVE